MNNKKKKQMKIWLVDSVPGLYSHNRNDKWRLLIFAFANYVDNWYQVLYFMHSCLRRVQMP